MSIYTYKLKGARWLRMWTAADRSSVYAAQSEAQKIADTLCDVPWTRAKSDGPAMFPLTAAKSLDENPANRDLFDAALFCAEHSDGAHRAYANAAMYLFKLPSTTGVHLNSVKVHVESDAYNALGARIAVHLLSSAELPTDCATVRTGAAHAEGVAARRTVERDGRNYWYSNSADVTITGGTSESPAAIGDLKQYLAVFVGMENYATSRNEWLEGASYIRNLIEIETDAVVTGWTAGGTYDCSDAGTAVLLSGGSSPTWLQPLPTVNVTGESPGIPAECPIVETFYGERFENVANEATVGYDRSYVDTHWTIAYSVTFRGTSAISAKLTGTPRGSYSGVEPASRSFEIDMTRQAGTVTGVTYFFGKSPADDGGGYYIEANLTVTVPNPGGSGLSRIPTCQFNYYEMLGSTSQGVARTERTYNYIAFLKRSFYVYLRLANGVLVDCDHSDSRDEDGRRHLPSTVENSATTGITWSLMVDNYVYNVTKSGYTLTLRIGSSTSGATVGTFYSRFAADADFFDPSVSIYLPGEDANDAVSDYGLASVVGDFSHAVATFEAGTQPSNAEVLGRLARMSKKSAQGMLYLHPAVAALADELDVLRPVPRFWRSSSNPSGQTQCQPGISVWYYRPSSGSVATSVFAYREGAACSAVKVANPVFLQLALLALRSPSAFGNKLVLTNYKPDTSEPPENIATDIANPFKLRFVAWVSPADQWDGSNAFAMAAMASMPSIYRSDGEDSVSWQADCSGSLMPLGVRTMTARRIGVSEVVAANIAAGGHIDIPLDARVGKGDVVLIAPEVLGFADGTGAASVHFGRQANPASAASKGAWARYTADLGWFPKVTGE